MQAVWKQSTKNAVTYPPLDGNGWKVVANQLQVDWDSEDNIAQIRTRVSLIKRGCGCKTGCMSARCKCRKAGSHCGPGCKCSTCSNLPTSNATHHSIVTEDVDCECDSDSDTDADSLQVDTIMLNVFGEPTSDTDSDTTSPESPVILKIKT